MSFRLGSYIGSGAYGMVIHAVEATLGTTVAIKKSRVSLRVKRTVLHYEARILQHLQGHPAIPSLLGYGRFPHFEYLAIQLCGESAQALSPRPQGTPLKTVLIIARQMISALEHIHSRGIIHRDVKPDHMLLSLQDPLQLILVDYGIAHPFVAGQKLKRYDPELERRQIIGTVKWASLNSHHGLNLSFRDDLESLAYVLLYLLRGGLPWENKGGRGTIFGEIARVRTLKTLWSGSKLAEGYPQEFGRFLDETRALEFEQVPPYAQYLQVFEDLYLRAGFDESPAVFDWSPVPPHDVTVAETRGRTTQVLKPGQLVSVELLAKPTILGITPDNVLWNTDLVNHSGDDLFSQPRLPAVVLTCTLEEDGKQHATFGILRRGNIPPDSRYVPVNTESISPELPGPSTDVRCYVFPAVESFVIAENLVPSTDYQISNQEVQALRHKLEGQDTAVQNEADRRAVENMDTHDDQFLKLARVHPLESETVDWNSERGWFDQIVSISKCRAADDAWPWTGTGAQEVDDGYLTNSYRGVDIADWDDRQQERDATLTLASLDVGEISTSLTIAPITEIIDDY